MNKKKPKVFPVLKLRTEFVLKEWEKPDKRPFFPGDLKIRFPFEDPNSVWNQPPKLDAPLGKVSKHSDLVFKDMGHLGNPKDKRGDVVLKS